MSRAGRCLAVLLACVAMSACTGLRGTLGPVEPAPAAELTDVVPDFAAPVPQAVVLAGDALKAPVTVAFGGDVHGEPPISGLLVRGQNPLDPIKAAWSKADAVMVNLETAVTDIGTPLDHEFIFNAPAQLLTSLKDAGVSVVSLANNHSGDFGTAAMLDTKRRAEAAGLIVVGVGADAQEAYAPKIIDARGLRIGFLALGRNIPNDAAVAGPSSPGQSDGRNLAFVKKVVADAKAKVDALVVMTHTGVERSTCPTREDRGFFDAVLSAGASVVVGNHPHVLQGIEARDGRLAMYSNGNFIFYPTNDEQRTTGVLSVHFDRTGKVAGYDFTPAFIDTGGRPVPLSGPARDAVIATLKARSPGGGACG